MLVFYEKNGLKKRVVKVDKSFLAGSSSEYNNDLVEGDADKGDISILDFRFSRDSRFIYLTSSNGSITLTSIVRFNNYSLQCSGVIYWPIGSLFIKFSALEGEDVILGYTLNEKVEIKKYNIKISNFNINGSINTTCNSESINRTNYSQALIPEPMYGETIKIDEKRLGLNRIEFLGNRGCADTGFGRVLFLRGNTTERVVEGWGSVVGGEGVWYFEGRDLVVYLDNEGGRKVLKIEERCIMLKPFNNGVAVLRDDGIIELINTNMEILSQVETLETPSKLYIIENKVIYLTGERKKRGRFTENANKCAAHSWLT